MIFNDTLPHTKKYWPFLEGHKRAIHYNKDLFNDNTHFILFQGRFMLKTGDISSNGRLPRTYKIVRITAHSTTISITERVKW